MWQPNRAITRVTMRLGNVQRRTEHCARRDGQARAHLSGSPDGCAGSSTEIQHPSRLQVWRPQLQLLEHLQRDQAAAVGSAVVTLIA